MDFGNRGGSVNKNTGSVHVKTAGIGRVVLTLGRAGGTWNERFYVEISNHEARALANVLMQATQKNTNPKGEF
jgi:hypothetical protein